MSKMPRLKRTNPANTTKALALAEMRVFTEELAAQFLGVSSSALRLWRAQDKENGSAIGPVFYRAGTRIRYLRSDLDDWINANRSRKAGRE
jgi:hypothetical protein